MLQTDWQAKQKWHNIEALLRHTTVYSLCWLPFGLPFALGTWAIHTTQDFYTSKLTHALAEEQDWHNFFVVVGFDQLLHYVQLVLFAVYCT